MAGYDPSDSSSPAKKSLNGSLMTRPFPGGYLGGGPGCPRLAGLLQRPAVEGPALVVNGLETHGAAVDLDAQVVGDLPVADAPVGALAVEDVGRPGADHLHGPGVGTLARQVLDTPGGLPTSNWSR